MIFSKFSEILNVLSIDNPILTRKENRFYPSKEKQKIKM